MAALAGSTIRRAGAATIVVANRTTASGARLAQSLGGRFAELDSLAAEIAAADLVISATGATQTVISVDDVAARRDRPLVVLDLALPPRRRSGRRPRCRACTASISRRLRSDGSAGTAASVADVAAGARDHSRPSCWPTSPSSNAWPSPRRSPRCGRAPTRVIEAELARLNARLPELDGASRSEVATSVRRAVEKLLHVPTVRVKELAATPEGDSYARALRELFDLDPAAVESVARPSGGQAFRPEWGCPGDPGGRGGGPRDAFTSGHARAASGYSGPARSPAPRPGSSPPRCARRSRLCP